MQLKTYKAVSEVYQIRCDRCGKETERGEPGFEEMRSIGFDAGVASIFGDGNRVDLDLCEPCLRETLGVWLRVKTPSDTPFADLLAKFRPEEQGGGPPPPK